ncbi:hypothetical protein JOD18_000759 [Gracilibacillus alcaliphilus]|nr:hypothetical protein [Gracilibacillus alcaliphilus]
MVLLRILGRKSGVQECVVFQHEEHIVKTFGRYEITLAIGTGKEAKWGALKKQVII